MTCKEGVKWLDSLIKTLGQPQYQSLWDFKQPLMEIKEMLEHNRMKEYKTVPVSIGQEIYYLDFYGGKVKVENINVTSITLFEDGYKISCGGEYRYCDKRTFDKGDFNRYFFVDRKIAENIAKMFKEV